MTAHNKPRGVDPVGPSHSEELLALLEAERATVDVLRHTIGSIAFAVRSLVDDIGRTPAGLVMPATKMRWQHEVETTLARLTELSQEPAQDAA
jgi:hypothetical protein